MLTYTFLKIYSENYIKCTKLSLKMRVGIIYYSGKIEIKSIRILKEEFHI